MSDAPRFVTAVSRTGSRIHAVDTTIPTVTYSLCRSRVTPSSRQEFLHTETATNCYLCCSRAERRLLFERE